MPAVHPEPPAVVISRRTPPPVRRRLWFNLHLWLGWITALPLLVVCLTGIVLAYEEEFYRWEQPEHYALQPSGTPLTLPEAIAVLERADLHLNHLEVPLDGHTAYLAFANGLAPDGTRRGLRAYVDPYRGTLTREWENPTFIRKVEVWHRTLGAGPAGRGIVAVSSLLLVIISIAGWALWWPMRRGTWRRFSTQRRALDWHNLAGLAALLPLSVLGVTGITFTWGRDVFPILDRWTGTSSVATVPKLSPLPDGSADTRHALAAVAQTLLEEYPNWQIRGVQGARPGSDLPYKFLLRRPDASLKNASLHLYIDPRTGLEIGRWDATASGPVGAYRQSFYIFHTGHGFPAWLRTGWALASAAGGLLIATGCWLSIRRWKRTRRSFA